MKISQRSYTGIAKQNIKQQNLKKQNGTKQTLNKNNEAANKSNFKGGISDGAFNLLDGMFRVLEINPMVQVSVVDTVATNIPRTVVDLKTGLAAALETCRREFSGLFVNCLMPSGIVFGVASLLPKEKNLKGTKIFNSWATEDTIEKLKTVYNKAQESSATDKTREYVEKAIGSLKGLNGKNWEAYANHAENPVYKDAVNDIVKAISTKKEKTSLLTRIKNKLQNAEKVETRDSLIKSAREKLAGLTKAETTLKFGDKPQANLSNTLRDIVDMGTRFNDVKAKTANSADVPKAINNYCKNLTKFVKQKSFIGMGIVIAIAISVQKINRAITRKQFNAEGAPIYKDFGKKDTTQKMDEKQKKKFKAKKILSAASMFGIAALSMMKKPSSAMFQFSGKFPTVDQCRWIASSTIASRMWGAEDENELRETTVRDIASFAGLYVLGDYVNKGVASAIEAVTNSKLYQKTGKKPVELLNRNIQNSDKAQKGISKVAKNFFDWMKNTELKSALEVNDVRTRNLRNLCKLADIGFSIIMLGILLPKYNRSVTEKKVAAAKAAEEQRNKNMFEFYQKQMPSIFNTIVAK